MHMVALRLGITALRDEADLYWHLWHGVEPHRQEGEPGLVVFPGLYALGLLDTARFLAEALAEPGRLALLEEAYRSAGARAAKLLGVVLVPGTVFVARSGRIGEMACVFGPEGELLGEQLAVHVPETGFVGGETWNPIATPLGTIGLLVGADAVMPEAARILALLGAEILVAPRAPESPYSSSEALAGLWQLCQQNQTFGVEAGLSGRAFGRSWDGKAALFAPCEVTPDGSGFLGRSGYLIRDGAAEARADIGELRRIRQDYPLLRQLNPALYRRYLPQLYGGDGP